MWIHRSAEQDVHNAYDMRSETVERILERNNKYNNQHYQRKDVYECAADI